MTEKLAPQQTQLVKLENQPGKIIPNGVEVVRIFAASLLAKDQLRRSLISNEPQFVSNTSKVDSIKLEDRPKCGSCHGAGGKWVYNRNAGADVWISCSTCGGSGYRS